MTADCSSITAPRSQQFRSVRSKVMAMQEVAHSGRQVARPLKVLVPLIQAELHRAHSAGKEHYRQAGEMLIEAQGQVARGSWQRWLTKNFELSFTTARTYMNWARECAARAEHSPFGSMRQMTGAAERQREERRSAQHQKFKRALNDIARDAFIQERQDRKDEASLHQELAVELVEIGYRALATRLHPDRGGTKDAMARLNRVRDELKHVAQTRRFV